MSQDMLKLAARCEAATGPDPKLDREILDTICEKWVGKWLLGPAKYRFTASLDAAMTLVPEGFRRAEYGTYENARGHWHELSMSNGEFSASAATPALALCAAALKARASQGKD